MVGHRGGGETVAGSEIRLTAENERALTKLRDGARAPKRAFEFQARSLFYRDVGIGSDEELPSPGTVPSRGGQSAAGKIHGLHRGIGNVTQINGGILGTKRSKRIRAARNDDARASCCAESTIDSGSKNACIHDCLTFVGTGGAKHPGAVAYFIERCEAACTISHCQTERVIATIGTTQRQGAAAGT